MALAVISRRAWIVPLLLVLCASAMTACTREAPSEGRGAPAQLLKAARVPVITLETTLQGRLEQRTGCLVAVTPDAVYAIVWPHDAVLLQEGGATIVESPSTQSRATLGQEVALRGGAASGLDATHVDGGVVGDNGQCAAPYWLTFAFNSP